jgi:hypothetical protein
MEGHQNARMVPACNGKIVDGLTCTVASVVRYPIVPKTVIYMIRVCRSITMERNWERFVAQENLQLQT